MQLSSLADCPACRVQGAVVEVWDSASPAAPLLSRCRMCARELEGGIEVRPPRRLARLGDVEEALARWAKEEGFAAVPEFVESAFVLGTPAAVHTALIVGDPVETTFDAMGFLFAGGDTPGMAAPDDAAPVSVAARPAPAARLGAVAERGFDKRNELLALASVAAADGRVVPLERAFLDAYARARGLAPLAHDEVRVHRPDEVGPVGGLLDRERVLEKMVECAFVDAALTGGLVDESEARVIGGFARAWGVDPARVEGWMRAWADDGAGLLARLLRRAARWMFPEA